jgi:hypothetical protein
MHDFYRDDSGRAVDAKFEAQRIAFGPMAFQASRAMRDLGILAKVSDSGEAGVAAAEIATALELSAYGVGVLLEMGLSLGLVKLAGEDGSELRFVLGKVGYFILCDELTKVNMDFVGDVCYEGAAALEESVRAGEPRGLKSFGDWKTIYEGLSRLPERAKASWFAFDHHYSDLAFPDALPIVFSRKPGAIFDVGGNTAKWALACCRYDPGVRVTIVDLPGQVAVARGKVREAGFADRVSFVEQNVLDPRSFFPSGADAVWMSQFLDCFSLEEVEAILMRLRPSLRPDGDLFVLEPLWDRQRFEAASYSLHATSLYFTCMANGNSKMYRSGELVAAVERSGYRLEERNDGLGANSYSLLRFRTA